MKWLRSQRWLRVCILFSMLVSGIGMEAFQISSVSLEWSGAPQNTSLERTERYHSSWDICCSEQLSGRILQYAVSRLRPNAGRSMGRTNSCFYIANIFVDSYLGQFYYRRIAAPLFYLATTHQLLVFIEYMHRQDGKKDSSY